MQHPLVVSGTAAETEPELLPLLAARGLAVQPRSCVDTPQTLVALARAGVGVGVANAVALAHTDTTGLVVLDVDDPEMVREVAAYWYEVLVSTDVGKALPAHVLDAPVPAGAVAAGTAGRPRTRRGVPEAAAAVVSSSPTRQGADARTGRRGPATRGRACTRSSAGSPSSACCAPGSPMRWPAGPRSCRSRVRPGSARPRWSSTSSRDPGAGVTPVVVRASGEETEALLAYGVVDQLARSAGDVGAPLLDAVPGHAPATVGDPVTVGTRMLELLDRLETGPPVVLVVDDAHWADRPRCKRWSSRCAGSSPTPSSPSSPCATTRPTSCPRACAAWSAATWAACCGCAGSTRRTSAISPR